MLRKENPADLIIKGGTIYTVEAGNSTVEAVAVVGDTIVYAGSLAGLSKYEGEQTKVLDLTGKTMTPVLLKATDTLWAWAIMN